MAMAAAVAPPADDVRRQLVELAGIEAADPRDVFELQRAEGAGAFGRVFRACYRSDPTRVVALKVIPVAVRGADRGEDAAAVAHEVRCLRAAAHPNVVAFFAAYYGDGELYVAMEYCGGGSAAEVRKRRGRPLDEREIAVVLRGALRGLAFLHSRHQLHRDVKGGNILLTRDGHVKLADFGVSAQLADTLATRATLVGTPYWMSPEMIQDGEYDAKADVWSLGITAIELADGKPPLFDEHPMRALAMIPRNPPPGLKTASAWSPLMVDFVRFLLQKVPSARPTAAECLEHPFIRGVDGIDRVVLDMVDSISRSEEVREQEPAEASSDRQSSAEVSIRDLSNPPTDGDTRHVDEEIAEVLEHLDDSASSGSSSSGSDSSSGMAGAVAPTDKSTRSSRDDLLDLSVDEGDGDVRALSASIRVPASLLPEPAKSPVRGRSFKPTAFSSSICEGLTTSALSEELQASLESDAGSINPLDALSGSLRVNHLLASLSVSGHHGDDAGSASLHRRSSFGLANLSTSLASFREVLGHSGSLSGSVAGSLRQPTPSIVVHSSRGFVGAPFAASHDISVRYNSISAQFEGVPPELATQWMPLHRQFGVPIEQLRARTSTGDELVPALLHMLRRELLRCGGLRSPWIYRASPDGRELTEARAKLDRGEFDPQRTSDPNVFASLLKLWLRELPEPLLGPVPLDRIAGLLRAETSTESRVALREPLEETQRIVESALRLSSRARAVLEWLLDHWLEVVEDGASNHMTAPALAVVMAPNMSRCEVENGDITSVSAMMNQVVDTLRVLLYWRQTCRDTGLAPSEGRIEPVDVKAAPDRAMRRASRSEFDVPAVSAARSGETQAIEVDPAVLIESELPRQSIAAFLRSLVDDAAAQLGCGREMASVFADFQCRVLQDVARYAKTLEEQAWVGNARLQLGERATTTTSNQLTQQIPASWTKVRKWLAAATSMNGFREIMKAESAAADKLARLRAMAQSAGSDTGVAVRPAVVVRQEHNRFLHLLRERVPISPLSSIDRHAGTDQHEADGSSDILLCGAQRLLNSRSDEATKTDDKVLKLAKLAEVEPVAGVLLLGVGRR